MEIILGTAASVATTIVTVLGAIFYLDRKIEANRRELSSEIRDVRQEVNDVRQQVTAVHQASQDAHTSIRADLADLKVEQAKFGERMKCMETHLQIHRPED